MTDIQALRVLHIFDMAGVAYVTAKSMDRLYGTKTLVFQRKVFDPYGQGDVYAENSQIVDYGAIRFSIACLLISRKYDILHIHDFDKLLPYLSRLYPKKVVVIQYHGDRIRGQWKEREHYYKNASAILYSVKDLESVDMPHKAMLLLDPIDRDLFKPMSRDGAAPKSALTFSHAADDLATRLANQRGLNLTILRAKIPYVRMPETLSEFEYYIDIKRDSFGNILGKDDSVSVTALQALACGLKVVKGWDNKIMTSLPEEHSPENVCRILHELYKELTQ